MRSKRGQITLFVIIGLVILALLGVGLYIQSSDIGNVDDEGVDEVQETSIDTKVLKNYVTQCVYQEAKRGLIKIGEHGGYVYANQSNFDIHVDSTESEVLSVYPGSSHKVPYWWYMSSENSERQFTLSSNTPTLEEIEKRLDNYVENNLHKCFEEFREVEKRGYEVVEHSGVNVTSRVTESDVKVSLDYSIELRNDESSVMLDKFETSLPVKFKDVYQLAHMLSVFESEGQFLEYVTLYLLSLHSGLDEDDLPPFGSVDSGYSNNLWIKQDIKQKVKQMLTSYIPLISINGTRGAQDFEDNSQLAQVFFFDQINKSFNDVYADFLYLGWPIYFDITPRDGQMLGPEVHAHDFPYQVMRNQRNNFYEFFYDVSFPVLVQLSDEEAFKGEGYDFFFALEGNIRDNIDMYDWYHGEGTIGPFPVDEVDASAQTYYVEEHNCTPTGSDWAYKETIIFENETECNDTCTGFCSEDDDGNWTCESEVFYEEREACRNDAETLGETCYENGTDYECDYNGNVYSELNECEADCVSDVLTNATGVSSSDSLFCNNNQALSGNITIRVREEGSGNPVEGAHISFGCGDYKTCSVGSTSFNNTLDAAQIVTKLPICHGGYVMAEKKGYLSKAKLLSTNYGQNDVVEIVLRKFYEINVSVSKMFYEDGVLGDEESAPTTKEKIVGSLELVGDDSNPYFIPHSHTFMLENDSRSTNIEISPGTWKVDLQLMDQREAHIGAEVSQYGEKPEQFIEGLPVGRAKLDNETGYWIVGSNITNYTSVRMKSIRLPLPSTYDELNELENLGNLSGVYRNQLEPELE